MVNFPISCHMLLKQVGIIGGELKINTVSQVKTPGQTGIRAGTPPFRSTDLSGAKSA
jgi:hypothetical protein